MDVEGDDVTTLNVWTFIENHQDFYTDMAEKWNEENPDRKVKLVLSNMAYDDMHNKLSLALESGEDAPDVVDIELGKFPAFMTGNIGLKDLTDAIAPYKDNVVQSRLDLYSKDGKCYGLPTHVGTTVAFYNTEALEAAGIDYTTIKTWDDFKEAGIKYHDATGKTFAAAETTAQWTLNLMLAQKGGSYLKEDGSLDVNNDKMVEVLQCMKDMQDAGALATIAGGQPDNEEAYPLFNDGEVAAAIMPFWQTSRYLSYMTDLSGKVAIAAPPAEAALNFKGAGRRFEVYGECNGALVIDDYAHHPTELRATLNTAKEMGYKRLIAVHQPFTYSRTKMLFNDFVDVLKIPDITVLTPIMGSREPNDPTITSAKLAAQIPGSVLVNSLQEAADWVKQNAQPGDLVITLGCGDIYKASKMMVEKDQ